MAVIIDDLELVPATSEQSAREKTKETPAAPAPAESIEAALRRLEERQYRVWAH